MGNTKSKKHSSAIDASINPKTETHDSQIEVAPHSPAQPPSTSDSNDKSRANSVTTTTAVTVIAPPSKPTKEATEHLHKELLSLVQSNTTKEGISVEPVNDNIFQWSVSLFDFSDDTQNKKDLDLYCASTGRSDVRMEVSFPFNYPQAPPYIRVVYPRFHQYTGHITIGGSICVKDLTLSGWSSKNQLLPFLIMMRNLLLEGAALINMDDMTDYTPAEAKQAFARVAKQHGWKV